MNDFNVAELNKGLSNELSQLDFAVTSWALSYTHPGDKESFAFFKPALRQWKKKKMNLWQKYGPITQEDSAAV